MILAPHILAGTAIALQSPNPVAGLILAVGAHYILDSIPHAEYSISPLHKIFRGEFRAGLPTAARIIIDGGAGIAVAVGMAMFFGYSPILAFAGGVAGVLPDGMTVLYFIFPNSTYLKAHNNFHQLAHYDKKTSQLPYLWKIGLQILTAVLAIAAIVF
ncbi:MAG: hypothetical protein HYV65_01135 [Candidatus Spechtbacteria bacterium]|nr:hypothetical protein [Candidatus Spechtbacteria bacterium]